MLPAWGERRKVQPTVCFGRDTHLEGLDVDGRLLGEKWTMDWIDMAQDGDGAINAGLPCLAEGAVIFAEMTPFRGVSHTGILVRI